MEAPSSKLQPQQHSLLSCFCCPPLERALDLVWARAPKQGWGSSTLRGVCCGKKSRAESPAAVWHSLSHSFNEEVLLQVLGALPAANLARLASASRDFAPTGNILLALMQLLGLPCGTTLRTAHVLEATPLNFVWHFSGCDVASGNDGWCTNFPVAMTLVAPNLSRPLSNRSVVDSSCSRSTSIHGEQQFYELPASGCFRWELEILQLNGLLAVGVGDGAMQDNAFLGAESGGSWVGWGWELKPPGRLEPVGHDITSGGSNQGLPLLKPGNGREIRLLLHLDCTQLLLELHVQLQDHPGKPRSWHYIGSTTPPVRRGHVIERDSLWGLRPVASTNVGAEIRMTQPTFPRR